MLRRLLVLAGLVALIAYVLRRHPAPVFHEPAVDPAEELRRKLDETRGAGEQDAVLTDDLDERRRAVHERGRTAADEMRGWASE